MKKYSWKKRTAVLAISVLSLIMIGAGSALAGGPGVAAGPGAIVDAGAAADAGAGVILSAGAALRAGEEVGPGVGAGYEELLRKSAEQAAQKEAGNAKQEQGPGVSQDHGSGPDTDVRQDTLSIDPEKPMVALTIDDGPYAPVGNRILDCLAEHEAKATFYVVGSRCSSYVEEMQRIAADGHELGNHTYSHKYLTKLGAETVGSEVEKGVEAIQETAGVTPVTVRLPGGLKNDTVLANVQAPMIMWSIDTLDWKTKDAQSTVDAVLNQVQDGDIILIHELYSTTADAVVQLVPALIQRGYQLVTVSELAAHRGGMENGKIYRHFRPEQ